MNNCNNDRQKDFDDFLNDPNNHFMAMIRSFIGSDPIDQACQITYQLFKGLIDAGFERHEALYLVGEIIKKGISK